MGILDYLLAAMGPEARKELATEAAKMAVKQAGQAIQEKAESVRREVQEAADERRARKEQAAAVEKRRTDAIRAERDVDDELAALKRRLKQES